MSEVDIARERLLNDLIGKIHDAESFDAIMPEIEPDLLKFLEAERLTVYRRGNSTKEIVSHYKTGMDIQKISLAINPRSIAGYVAMSQEPVLILDAYDEKALKELHKELSFNRNFDSKSKFRTQSVLAVPIKFKDVALGVLQVINFKGGESFEDGHLERAEQLAKILGQKFRYELRGTHSPYDHLVQTKRITAAALKEYLDRAKKQGSKVHELLMSEAGITALELGTSYSKYYHVPFQAYDSNLELPAALLKSMNLSYLRQSLWVPLEFENGELVVLIDDPTDTQRILEIQSTVSAERYTFKIGFPEDILRFLGQGSSGSLGTVDMHELVGKLQEEDLDAAEIYDEEVDENEATVIQLVNQIIISAFQAGASDIHIEPGKAKKNAIVRTRVDGICRASLSIPATHIRAVIARIKIMSALDITERRIPQDGKCALRYKGRPIELRVATIPTVNGESAVLRILSAGETLPLDKINLLERNSNSLKHLIVQPHGILLVVGPTGSGKTTTLHAVLGELNSPERKIWTAEDPVEITQRGLQQVQMRPGVGLNFSTALRSFLRGDPDIIMIGEMRDNETAQIGLEASLTGHLVFSTLHTNSAPETVVRLLDLGLDPLNFSDALLGVLAQRLVRTLCGDCKEKTLLTEEDIEVIKRYYGSEHFSELEIEPGKTEVYKAKGCEKCGNTGYRGRTGVHELLVGSEEIKHLIYQKASASDIEEVAIQQGMRTLMQDGIAKFLLGQTDLDQIRRVAMH